jgi:hypothetical protein
MDEALKCARFGDHEELEALLQAQDQSARDALVNFVHPDTLNTPLHMGPHRLNRLHLWSP